MKQPFPVLINYVIIIEHSRRMFYFFEWITVVSTPPKTDISTPIKTIRPTVKDGTSERMKTCDVFLCDSLVT